MSSQDSIDSRRHKPRLEVDTRVDVVDSMTGQVVGRIGNISESGMLLLATAPLRADALYQLRFDLAAQGQPPHPIEVGAHLLWLDPDQVPGRAWAGLHFIHLPASQRKALVDWMGRR